MERVLRLKPAVAARAAFYPPPRHPPDGDAQAAATALGKICIQQLCTSAVASTAPQPASNTTQLLR